MQRAIFHNMVLVVLLLCALVTTGLVVRREVITKPPTAQASTEPTFLDDWRAVLTHGIRTGPAHAPVQVVEFADFQCPYCAQFEERLVALSKRHSGKVAVTFVHSPLPSHPQAELAARVAECAHAQGRFEAMKAVLFQQQALFGTSPWLELGRQATIPDLELFQSCVDSNQPIERIVEGRKLTSKLGIRGTPTILVNGWLFPRPPSTKELDAIVSDVLKAEPRR